MDNSGESSTEGTSETAATPEGTESPKEPNTLVDSSPAVNSETDEACKKQYLEYSHTCQAEQIYYLFDYRGSSVTCPLLCCLSFACSAAEAGSQSTSCDVAEELSRQLEDILSTYCQVDGSEDPPIPNGQPDGAEVNGLADREDGKSEHTSLNGSSGAEKDQKKQQEKKKVKGLGKWILVVESEIFLFICLRGTFDQTGICQVRGRPQPQIPVLG